MNLTLVTSTLTAGATELTFDYNWRFHLGDPVGVTPTLTAASVDPSFTRNISGTNCSFLVYAARRPEIMDCRGACSTTPGCLAWQYGVHDDVGNLNSCFIHDAALGTPPVCTKTAAPTKTLGNPPPYTLMHGESRDAVPPLLQDRPGVTFKETAFDDSKWATVDAPHDFIKSGTYAESAAWKHGFMPRNVTGWYRKRFNLPAAWKGGATFVRFEGVFLACDIFLNGIFVHRNTAGYLGFEVRLDAPGDRADGAGGEGSLAFGPGATSANVLAVRVDASFGSGHWYEGGGLVRKVFLKHTPTSLRFATNGIFAQSDASTVPASGRGAVVVPTAEVLADGAKTARVLYALVDRASGAVVASSATPATPVSSTATTLRGATLAVAAANLWSVLRPSLYVLTAALVDAASNATVDSKNITIGLRHIDWAAPGGGFALNGAPLHLRGFSHHQDFGGTGTAVPDRVNLFKVNALRSVGGNTWRTSHNPYDPAVYDIMDAVGVMCWDENRIFTPRNTGDMEELVRRDRNHPSVVIWSACNEVECVVSGTEGGQVDTAKGMRAATKKWDTTRPFSLNSWNVLPSDIDHLAPYVDVEGFSHGGIGTASAKTIHAQNPGKAMVSSECCSCESQRGEDFLNASAGIKYPHTASQASCMESCIGSKYPYWQGNPLPGVGVIAGTLGVWTLFDYAGESGAWPQVVSSFGQFDLAGFAKSAAYWYRSLWLAAVPAADAGRPPLPPTHVVRVSQTWNVPPPNASSVALDVQVFSDLPVVELILNGRSLGTQPCGAGTFAAFAAVPFTPGNLTAVARQSASGAILATHTQLAATAPASIELTLDAPSAATGTGTALLLDGHDAGLIRATVRDAAGRVVPMADNYITFAVESGPGRIAGVHNGDAKSQEPQVATSRSAYFGLARAVVKVTVDAASAPAADLALLANEIETSLGDGKRSVRIDPAAASASAQSGIVVTATSPGLTMGKVTIPVSADASVHSVLAVAAASTELELAFN